MIFALGGIVRRLFDDLDAGERQNGVDLPGGRGGYYHVTSVDFILRILEHKFPVHAEAYVAYWVGFL